MSDELMKLVNWAFGGIGVTAIGWIETLLFKKWKEDSPSKTNQVTVSQTVNVGSDEESRKNRNVKKFESIDEAKGNAKLLFIDDDTRFNVVKILRKAGWTNTEIGVDHSQKWFKSRRSIFGVAHLERVARRKPCRALERLIESIPIMVASTARGCGLSLRKSPPYGTPRRATMRRCASTLRGVHRQSRPG